MKTERFELLLEPHEKRAAEIAARLLQTSIAEVIRMGALALAHAVISARGLPIEREKNVQADE